MEMPSLHLHCCWTRRRCFHPSVYSFGALIRCSTCSSPSSPSSKPTEIICVDVSLSDSGLIHSTFIIVFNLYKSLELKKKQTYKTVRQKINMLPSSASRFDKKLVSSTIEVILRRSPGIEIREYRIH